MASVVASLLTAAALQMAAAPNDSPIAMNPYLVNIQPISSSCLRRFMRLKVPEVSVALAIDVDASKKVSSATLESRSADPDLDACIVEWVRTAQFRPDSPNQGIYIANLIDAKLSPPSPKYEQPSTDGSVEIRNWSRLALCKVTGLSGPREQAACRASVLLIDGRRTSFLAGQNRVVPGLRTLTLSCDVHDHSGGGLFVATGFSQTKMLNLKSKHAYELVPRWQGSTCVVDVLDAVSKQVQQEHTAP